MIAQKKMGVDVYTFYLSGGGQLHYSPVVAGYPLAAAFPAVHPFAAVGVFVSNKYAPTRFDQVFFFSKKIICSKEDFTPQPICCQVGELGESR